MDADDLQKGGGPVAEKKIMSADQQKTALSEKLWLAYFNSYLYQHGMITENQRNRMIAKIESRKGSAAKEKEQ